MVKSTATTRKRKVGVQRVRLTSIHPSPENDNLYQPIDPNDPEMIALADSIQEHGLLEPIIVTADGWIISGHRRHAAAKLAGLVKVPVRRIRIRRANDLGAFVRLLREHNRQRDKTNAEKLREELVSITPADAHRELSEFRRNKAAIKTSPLKVGHVRLRKVISDAKRPMVEAIQHVLNERLDFWPLSDRAIHYALLNNPPRRHARKRGSAYRNDRQSYGDLTDLLTRLRLTGEIPFEAISDETRPVAVWNVHRNVRPFIRDELECLFWGYYRNRMQSQPNHVEIVCEKNTVMPVVRPVASEYTIPITSGRGYCSLAPRHAMAERFEESGKSQLILLIVSDFDPEGEDIAHSFARSMRDDFGIDQIHPVKVALTARQVTEHKLPAVMQAKKKSSRYKSFVTKHGKNVFELEALPPETLQRIVRSAIEGLIDVDAYEAEITAERDDATFINRARVKVHSALRDIDLEETDED